MEVFEAELGCIWHKLFDVNVSCQQFNTWMYLVFMCFEYCCCVLIEAYFIAFWHKFGLFVNIFCPLEHMQQQLIFLEKTLPRIPVLVLIQNLNLIKLPKNVLIILNCHISMNQCIWKYFKIIFQKGANIAKTFAFQILCATVNCHFLYFRW